MLFEVVRASINGAEFDAKRKPCDEASRRVISYTESETFINPEEAQNALQRKLDGQDRYSFYAIHHGKNPRLTSDNTITWDIEREAWILRIADLKELAKFINKYGNIIIDKGTSDPDHGYICNNPFKLLCIYDYYVE